MNIVLIGVGSLGYRHLQSLYELKKEHNIYAIEINTDAIIHIREEMPDVRYVTDASELPDKIGVAIFATGSNVRRMLFEKLIQYAKVRYIIFEKVLFQKAEDYYFVKKKLDSYNIKAWVNCARREWKSYIDFKEELKNAKEMHFSAIGGDWGLGCNGIHMLDLIQFLSGDNVEQICVDSLENHIYESKRKGFYEFCGSITGRAGKCKTFKITSMSDSELPFFIDITSDIRRYMIEEGKNIRVFSADNEWNMVEKNFNQVYQSQLTGRVVKSIVENGNCNLTSYDESMELHLKYISKLLMFFKKNGMEGDTCPIT